MQIGLGLQHVGTLADQVRWEADRKIGRQSEIGKRQLLRRRLAWILAGKNGELIMKLGFLFHSGGNVASAAASCDFCAARSTPLA